MEVIGKSGRPWKKRTNEFEEDLNIMGIRNWHKVARDRKVHKGLWCLRRKRTRRRREEEEEERVNCSLSLEICVEKKMSSELCPSSGYKIKI
jgi:hypothetical protein